MENSIISEIGGVTMKTLEEVKPVIDEAVASASNTKDELADTRDRALDKDAAHIESGISVQDVPPSGPATAAPEAPARQAVSEREEARESGGPDFV